MDGRTVTVMKLSTLELNRLADNIVAQGLTCYLHTGDPGANGTANRIAGVSAQLSAASWSNAADGDVTYNADIEFAQLHATRTITPTALTIFRGAAFVSEHSLGGGAPVPGGNGAIIRSGALRLNGSTP